MERRMKNKEINVFRRTLFLLVLIIVFGILTACGNPSMIPVTVVPEIHVKALPAYITSVEFTVTGPGMEPLSASYDSLPDSINLAIPPGEDRYFELLVYVDGLLGLTPAISFKGSATVDLTPGDVVVELTMRLDSTKLVVPDAKNYRLVMIDDMSGAGWIAKNWLDFGFGSDFDFLPYDVDFDSRGRIYIANGASSASAYNIIRINDMSDISLIGKIAFGDVDSTPKYSLAVDRGNDVVYYANSTQLYRCDLDGGSIKSDFVMGTIGTIRGMAVDENGILYIAGNTGAGANMIFMYDPITELIINSYGTTISTAWDVLLKPPAVYIANQNGGLGYKIIELDTDLGFVDAFGNQSPVADDIMGNFYGPKRFLAILNKKIYILDEASTNEAPFLFQGDRLVAMSDITGADWETYGQTGTGVGQFEYYWAC